MAAGSKPASITLTLNRGPFKDGLKDSEKDVKSFSEQANKALKTAFSDGLKGAGSAVSGLVSSVKNAVGMMAGIGGAMGIAELIRAATITTGVYKGMAAGVQLGTGRAADFRDMMADGSKAAMKWGKNVDEIGAAMNRVRTETGDVDFAKKSADTIAMASRASHESIDSIAGLSSTLHKSFSITDDALDGTLATILSLSNKGGVGFGEMSEAVKKFGVIAKQSGMSGEGGLAKFLGLISAGASGAAGMGRNIAGASSLLDQLSQATPARSMLLMRAGMTGENGTLDPWSPKLKGKDPTELLKMMVASMGGKKERMAMTFEGDQLAFMSDLGAVYKKAYDATSGGMKAKMDAGMGALDKAIKEAAQGAVDGADLQKMANDAMKDGPAKMEAALEKMRAAFLKPEIADAVSKLADVLPKLAELVSSAVGFASAHPIAAGAAVVGGTAAKGFGEAALSSLISSAFASGGAGAAKAIGSGVAAAGESTGAAAGASFLIRAAPLGAALGAAIGIAALAYQAHGLYKDVTSEGSSTKKDKAGSSPLWREFLHDIGAMDDTVYQKQWEDATGMKSGYDSRLTYDDAQKRKLDAQTHAADEDAAGFSFGADQMGGGGYSFNDEGPKLFGPRADMVDKPNAPARSADDQRLLAEMLASRELKVRVVNPEQMRDGGGPGNPRPGYVPRE